MVNALIVIKDDFSFTFLKISSRRFQSDFIIIIIIIIIIITITIITIIIMIIIYVIVRRYEICLSF